MGGARPAYRQAGMEAVENSDRKLYSIGALVAAEPHIMQIAKAHPLCLGIVLECREEQIPMLSF